MGIGAMTVAMLGLPLTSVLLATLFLQADAVALMPLVIVAVVVAVRRVGQARPGEGPRATHSHLPGLSTPDDGLSSDADDGRRAPTGFDWSGG